MNSEGIFVDTIYLDSVHYASGAKVWCLRGVLVMDGDAYPYSLLYAENPLKSNSMMLQSNPPTFFPVEGKELKSVMTKSNGVITISWKSGKKKLLVRSALTSEH